MKMKRKTPIRKDYEYFKYQLKINRNRYPDICDLLDYEKEVSGLAYYIRNLINEDVKKRVLSGAAPFENSILEDGVLKGSQQERENTLVEIEAPSIDEARRLAYSLAKHTVKKHNYRPNEAIHKVIKQEEEIIAEAAPEVEEPKAAEPIVEAVSKKEDGEKPFNNFSNFIES